MFMLAIIFALSGAALGSRFKALVLVPASGLAVSCPVLMNFAYGYSLRMQLLAVIATVMALQIGYLLGLAIRLKVTPERPRVIEGTSVGVFGLIDDAKLAEALRDRARCPLTERFGVNRANGWAPEIDPPSEPHARTEGWGSAPAQHP
jgi:hypothetical protein